MLKLSKTVDIKNSTLILIFSSNGNASNIASTLLVKNYPFENIGFYYSQYMSHSVCENGNGNLEFNGSLFFNENKKILILDLSGGISKNNWYEFNEEFFKFLNDNKFKEIYILSSSDKENLIDKEIKSNEINIYYETNKKDFKCDSMKKIQDAYEIEENKKENKIYYELGLVEISESEQKILQKMILDKIDFIFIFTFRDDIFDPFTGLALFYKIAFILGLNEKDEKVIKKQINALNELNEIEKIGLKIDSSWKILLLGE